VIFVVGSDPSTVAYVATALERRYDRDYRVDYELSGADALARLESMQKQGERVALVLAEPWMPELSGVELLSRVGDLHPGAGRALLIEWGDWGDEATADAIREAIAVGQIDYYVLKPWKSPDEQFHHTIAEFLQEWATADTSAPYEVTLVADAWSARSSELRSLLSRNGVPHVFHPSDSPTGQRLVREVDLEGASEPVVILLGGRVLVDPSNAELARAYGVSTELGDSPPELDVAVVGAGPAGLASAVYASSEGLSALVVERESIGGQAGSSSRIRNYLGFARGVAGAELAQRAYQQAWVFGTRFMVMREVSGLRTDGALHHLTIPDGGEIMARSVVLAMGVSYRRLEIPALEALGGAGVFYGSSPSQAQQFAGGLVYVLGGGNSAGQAAIHLAGFADQVTIVVRGPDLAASMSSYLIEEIEAAPNIEVALSTQVVDGTGEQRLEQLELHDSASGSTPTVPADALFVMIGARPHTNWLPAEIARDQHGFVLTGPDLSLDSVGWPLERSPFGFETSVPGVFAVGDVRSRSVKRVAAAVGEGSVVVQQVHSHLDAVPSSHGPGKTAPAATDATARTPVERRETPRAAGRPHPGSCRRRS
jgi:thioredoxin reductase (NADPH)